MLKSMLLVIFFTGISIPAHADFKIGCDSAVCDESILRSCVQRAANAKCGRTAVRTGEFEFGTPQFYDFQRCVEAPSGQICETERHCQQQAWARFRCR